MTVLEICANSVPSALAAQKGGAHRVELCTNLSEGGTTPSYGDIALARKYLNIRLYVLIRPRAGDFLYSDLEFELMKEDIKLCKTLGCDGVVIGMLTAEGQVDKERCRELLEVASPLPATFHRAFDRCADPFRALEEIIELGFERILTSGCQNSALEGAELIGRLVERAGKRIKIMPGAGINKNNVLEVLRITGAPEVHASAKQPVASRMLFRSGGKLMGENQDDFCHQETSVALVEDLSEQIKQYSRPATAL